MVAITKSELQELIYRRDRVLRWIQSQGAVFYYDPDKHERLKSYLSKMPWVFPLFQLGVYALYVYRQEDQPVELKNCDAICWDDVTTDGIGTLHAIGISTTALDRGPEYTQFVFLHELTHVTHGGEHTAEFHAALDELIDLYNRETGAVLANDYYGIRT